LGVAESDGFDPFWVVTRHADILEISRQNSLFLNGARSPTIVNKEIDQRVRQMMGGSPHLLRTLIHMDAPDHPKYRILTQAWFMPANLKRLEERIRVIARSAVERMLATGGRCDFVGEVALHYPLHVVMDILGVPEEDEPRMLRLTQELFGASDPELRRKYEAQTDEANQLRQGVIADFYNYFAKLSAARKADPRDDLASVIANSEVDGRPISEFESMSYYIIVATAGHDTTSSSTAGALWALAERPAELAKVRADPSLIPGLVDESIRWTTPVKTFMRTVAEDTEFAGRQMRKDDWLMLCYASGNRDETVFEHPQEFRVDRSPNRHLAFGYGAHVCLGQHLAKMEMRILWEELLPKIDRLELAGEPKMSEAAFVNGPKSLPVRFKAA
jgi:cytochrome P450